MNRNIDTIATAIDYIEQHLEDEVSLDTVAKAVGYSKYHLHRMFSSVVGMSLNTYIVRRKLTESARLLINTEKSILDIALASNYETQRSFGKVFRQLYKSSPQAYRKKGDHTPLQLKFIVDGKQSLRGDNVMDIEIMHQGEMKLLAYHGSTKFGFGIIGKCMRKLLKNNHIIPNRVEPKYLIALNDYSVCNMETKQSTFDFYGACEVSSYDKIPKEMVTKTLPASKYVIFKFKGRPQDSMEPVANYIYKEWFPQSTYQFNEKAMYDFSKSGTEIDKNGNSDIEYWIPVLE